jgi:acetyl esterase/lipase
MRKLAIGLLVFLALAIALGWLLLPPGLVANLKHGATIVRSGRAHPADESRSYKQTPTRPLQMHIFRRDEGAPAGATVLLFHGGGFHSGWPEEYFPLAYRLKAAGHSVFVAEYRLQRADGVAYPEELADCRDAVAWLQARAADFGGDAAKLVIGGSSAGAHLAAAVLTLPREDGSPQPEPIGLILQAPFVDSGDASERFAARGDPGPVARWLMGEPRDVFEGRSREYSPREHLRADLPPTVMLVGEDDRLHPPARAFCENLSTLGVDCRVTTYPDVGHAFALYGYEHHEAFVQDVLAAIDRWLAAAS